MRKSEAVNTISDGLILDLNPLQMPNTALSNCLNGTLLTFNGNENVLLNDMGNARVETAMLPAGYVPLGTTSFGGIIYIVSLNPLTKEYQIGSFPSPERNLSKDELGDESNTTIDLYKFCDVNGWKDIMEGETVIKPWSEDTVLTSYYYKTNLTKFKVYPGDKYKVYSDNISNTWINKDTEEQSDDKSIISAWNSLNNNNADNYPAYVKLDIISTLDSGETITLTDNSVWSAVNDNPSYYIYADNITQDSTGKIDLDEYRDLVGSNYDVYLPKVSGNLGIAATLEVPTTFSVGYDVLTTPVIIDEKTKKPSDNEFDVLFYFYLNWTNNKKGEFKSANNPNSVKIAFWYRSETTSGDTIVQSYTPINCGKTPIELQILNTKTCISPDNLVANKYCTIIPPNDYFSDNWKIDQYLKNGKNEFSESVPRKNDGTDFQYLMIGPKIRYFKDTKKFKICDENCHTRDGIIDLKLTPIMPFGELLFLELTLKVNLDKLQTGEMYLNAYQYYVGNTEINMDFNIEAYPELGKSIKGLNVNLYPIKNETSDIWKKQATYDSESSKQELGTKIREGFSVIGSATGTQHVKFNRNNLEKDNIYVVEFEFKYGGDEKDAEGNPIVQERYFYRLLFNSTIFNNDYGSEYDFKDLKLYSPNLRSGIKPEFKFDQNIISNTSNIKSVDGATIPNEDNLPLYKESLIEADKVTHLYQINHEINSTYTIDSGLGDMLKLEVETISFNDTHAEYESECTLKNTKYELKVDVKDSIFKLKNSFNLEVLYNIDYSNSEEINIYDLEPLVKDRTLVRMAHWSKNKDLGHFNLYYDKDWETETYEYKFLCPKDTKGLVCYSDSYEDRLLNLLETNHSDYITALFGIEEMQDDNAGYGFNYDNTSYYYKFSQHKCHYLLVNVVRKSDGNVAIIHNNNISLPDNVIANEDLLPSDWNKDFYRASKYAKDALIIKNTYEKYVKTGKSKTLFYIKNISNNNDLSVNTNYVSNVNIDISNIILPNNCIISNRELDYANNLLIDNIEGIDINIPITNTIDNKDLLYKAQHIDFVGKGWYNNSIINLEDLDKVYDGGTPISTMSLRNGVLFYNDTKLVKVDWAFGWEDMLGANGTNITADKFNTCMQNYEFRYTYKAK